MIKKWTTVRFRHVDSETVNEGSLSILTGKQTRENVSFAGCVSCVSGWASEGVRARLGRFCVRCVTDERVGAGRRRSEWLVWVSGWASEISSG